MTYPSAILASLCLLSGCASVPSRVTTYKPPVAPQGIVIVTNGAGGNTEASRALVTALEKSRVPLSVRTFEWTHGVGRAVTDMTDFEHAQEQGRLLAEQIITYRAAHPNTPIYLVGYSAGTHVTLEATRWLDPNTVERVILLAPAVSSEYDMSATLAAARQGVDVYTSQRDRLYLGTGTDIVGTADGLRGVAAAGRVGFDPPSPLDSMLAMRLRQHPWNRNGAWTGNDGSHAGPLQSTYLRAYILPLLSPPADR